METDWVGLGTKMGLAMVGVGVHARGVGLRLLYLYGEGIVGLEGCFGAGRGGQSVSVMTRGEGTSCSEGRGGGSVWFWVGWVRCGYAVVEPPDKNVIAFCGKMEFVTPVQILIIQGGWQFVK